MNYTFELLVMNYACSVDKKGKLAHDWFRLTRLRPFEIRRHQMCYFSKHATSAAAEFGGEIHTVSRSRARTRVLLQAQKLHVYNMEVAFITIMITIITIMVTIIIININTITITSINSIIRRRSCIFGSFEPLKDERARSNDCGP